MKDLKKIEFMVVTILFITAITILFANINSPHEINSFYNFKNHGISFSYFGNYFLPELFKYAALYINFLLLNFIIIPALLKRENTWLNFMLLIILFLCTGLTISVANTYAEAHILVRYDTLQEGYNQLFINGFSSALWIIVIMTAYALSKEFIRYYDQNKHDKAYQSQMKIDAGFGLAFWFVGLMFWIASTSHVEIAILWTLICFSAIATIIYSLYYLLPEHRQKSKKFAPYFWQICLLSILLSIPISLICFLLAQRSDLFAIALLFHFPTQLILSAPLAWYIYKKRLANDNELTSLRTELGRSDASLSFLQSQINPHFLFNALNTLYGTALQENAERTSEGIQKLGDMMRFMLHENMQEKISLTRDVDYLENYIALQKLRTSRSADIIIDTQIDEQLNNFEITPMLLIPFVENAFKHGISLQHPSHIKITLQTKENTLYFDVHNSIHIKADNDPEKLKSGIGLQNVKQRLALLYPAKHELIIRESAKEFFIHLTLQL